jgi:hypothetical protein
VSNRRRVGREGNIFDNGGIVTSEITDSAIFGSIAEIDAGRQVAKPVSIFDIYPDPLQPRRAIPSPVRIYWDGRPATTATLFDTWFRMAVEERGKTFEIASFLSGLDEVPRPEEKETIGPIHAALIDLLEMAANIRENGLTNPITVAHTGNGYHLETGERRWLAYHILNIYFEDEQEKWNRIPARVVEDFSVWRQASENNARSNLNAISKARQLAILMMDLYQQQRGKKFRTFEEMVGQGECDRAFYAQVADGDAYPVLPGTSEAVLTAGGFKARSLMSEHRKLLSLPDEVWRIADDLNWTQGRIRQLERKAKGDPNTLISLALKQALADGYKIGISQPPTPPIVLDEANVSDNSPFSTETLARFNKMMKVIKAIGEGSKKVKDVDIWEIQHMREWLTEVEKIARINMKK